MKIRKLTHNEEVRGLQVISHIIGVPAIIYAIYMGWWGYLATGWLTYWVIGTLGINVAFHRLISHRSYKTSKFWEYLFAFIGIYTTVGSPLAWVALHREHHKHAETEKDPHSPYVIGWWRAWFGWWNIQRINPRTIKDIRKEKFYTITHKYYTHILVASIIIMALFDPWLVAYLWAVPALLCLHSTSAIIVIAHFHGYKTYKIKDESRNSWIASLATLGEGWHNNHHAHPGRWKQGEKWWEFDVPAMIIRMIKT